MPKPSTVPLPCVITLATLSPAQLRNVMCNILKWRKIAIESQIISTGVQRRCRRLMMYEVRRSVHQRAGRLLLHPETPLSLCQLPEWRSITPLSSPISTHHHGSSQSLHCVLDVYRPRLYSPSPLIRSSGVIGPLPIPADIYPAWITEPKVSEWRVHEISKGNQKIVNCYISSPLRRFLWVFMWKHMHWNDWWAWE